MLEKNTQTKIDTNAVLTCPICKTKQKVIMPSNQFQHYYKCTNENCCADLSPLEGKDCIFCSYADKPCPPRQNNPQLDEVKPQSLL